VHYSKSVSYLKCLAFMLCVSFRHMFNSLYSALVLTVSPHWHSTTVFFFFLWNHLHWNVGLTVSFSSLPLLLTRTNSSGWYGYKCSLAICSQKSLYWTCFASENLLHSSWKRGIMYTVIQYILTTHFINEVTEQSKCQDLVTLSYMHHLYAQPELVHSHICKIGDRQWNPH
jgi:hypothetical protein